jgi:hypothetical protein
MVSTNFSFLVVLHASFNYTKLNLLVVTSAHSMVQGGTPVTHVIKIVCFIHENCCVNSYALSTYNRPEMNSVTKESNITHFALDNCLFIFSNPTH